MSSCCSFLIVAFASSAVWSCTPEFKSGVAAGSNGGAPALLDSGAAGDPNSGSTGGSSAATNALPKEGLLLWLRGDVGVSSVNGSVSLWADQSGHKLDATQADAESRPSQAPASIGGHAAVRFDGTDDFLTLPTTTSDFGKGLTLFAVINEQEPQSYNSVIELSNGSEIDDISLGEYQDRLSYEVAAFDTQGSSMTYGAPAIIGVVHREDTTLVMRMNGQLAGAAQCALPDSVARKENYIGKSLYGGSATFAGLLGELLVYTRALNEVEVQTVETELKGRWGL